MQRLREILILAAFGMALCAPLVRAADLTERDMPANVNISPSGQYVAWTQDTHLLIRSLKTGTTRSFQLDAGNVWFRWVTGDDQIIFESTSIKAGQTAPFNIICWKAEANQFRQIASPAVNPVTLIPGIAQNLAHGLLTVITPDGVGTLDITTGDVRTTVAADLLGSQNIAGPEGRVFATLRAHNDRPEITTFRFTATSNRPARTLQNTFDDSVSIVNPAPFGYFSNAAETRIFAISGRNRDKAALVELDLATGAETVLLQHARVDISQYIPSADRRHIRLARLDDGLPIYMAPSYDARGSFSGFSRSALYRTGKFPEGSVLRDYTESLDGSAATLLVSSPSAADYWALWDRKANTLSRLFPAPPTAGAAHKVSGEAYYVTDRKIPVLLWKAEPQLKDDQDKLAVLIHGGPQERLYWQHQTLVDDLLKDGYTVLGVNYRGSTGYGDSWRQQGEGNFKGMLTDITDATNWYLDKTGHKAARVVLVADSFGGLLARHLLAKSPLYDSGIFVSGVLDAPAWVSYSSKADWVGSTIVRAYFGCTGTPAPVFQLSCAYPSDSQKVERPILVLHGTEDKVVPLTQTEKAFAGMTRGNTHATMVPLQGMGHHIAAGRQQQIADLIHSFLTTRNADSAEHQAESRTSDETRPPSDAGP